MTRAESPARAPSRASTVMTGRSTPGIFRTRNSVLYGVEEDDAAEELSSKGNLTESPHEVSTQISNEAPTGTSHGDQANAAERNLHEAPKEDGTRATNGDSAETVMR